MESDEQPSHDEDESAEPERTRRPRDLPVPSTQAWAIVAPHLVLPRPKVE
jgi:hypothetical protein